MTNYDDYITGLHDSNSPMNLREEKVDVYYRVAVLEDNKSVLDYNYDNEKESIIKFEELKKKYISYSFEEIKDISIEIEFRKGESRFCETSNFISGLDLALRAHDKLRRLAELEEINSTFGSLTFEEQKEKREILEPYNK